MVLPPLTQLLVILHPVALSDRQWCTVSLMNRPFVKVVMGCLYWGLLSNRSGLKAGEQDGYM